MTDAERSAEARWQQFEAARAMHREKAAPSNSRLRDTSVAQVDPPSGCFEAGIDSARFLFRLHDIRQKARAEAEFARPSKLAGEMSFGYSAGHELVWAEGRPATLLSEDGDERWLLPPSALSEVTERVGMALDEHGLSDARPIGPSRLDHTATIRFDRPTEGWAFLHGMYALDVPRRKPAIYGRPPETVYWLLERSGEKADRAYCKGTEQANAAPGTLIRLEARVRIKGEQRTAADWWSPERVREQFLARFAAMGRSAEGLLVGDEHYVRQQIAQLVGAGAITDRMAELLIGHLGCEKVGLKRNARARQRRRAELRRLGLALALDGDDDGQALDLAAVLDDVLTSPHWHD